MVKENITNKDQLPSLHGYNEESIADFITNYTLKEINPVLQDSITSTEY